jgi:hypothetical protein
LPNVVLFPDVDLPLHIFEPRYRDMVRDAMAGDHLIGMVLLRPDWRSDYHGSPPIYPIGCVGRIETFEILDDGRSNLVLHGRRRFEILEEVPGRTYRRARVRWCDTPPCGDDPGVRERLRACVVGLLQRAGKAEPEETWDRLPKEWDRLVNLLAFGLPLEEVEKMALLECDGPGPRAARMIEILEFRLAEHGLPGSGARGGGSESWH